MTTHKPYNRKEFREELVKYIKEFYVHSPQERKSALSNGSLTHPLLGSPLKQSSPVDTNAKEESKILYHGLWYNAGGTEIGEENV